MLLPVGCVECRNQIGLRLDNVIEEPSKRADHSPVYGPEYFASHCGTIPYTRAHAEHWGRFFGTIADELICLFRPARVFDAGCAHGFLVEALRDRGVEAWGRDISDYAISQVRADIRSHCSVGNLTDKIEGHYDLVVCIEVLEHMPEPEAERAIVNMTSVTDRIVFSSSPDDFAEPTHVNVKPAMYWLDLFAANGFSALPTVALPSITPYALAFERSNRGREDADLLICAELIRHRLELSRLQAELSSLQTAYRAILSSTSWRLTMPIRTAIDQVARMAEAMRRGEEGNGSRSIPRRRAFRDHDLEAARGLNVLPSSARGTKKPSREVKG